MCGARINLMRPTALQSSKLDKSSIERAEIGLVIGKFENLCRPFMIRSAYFTAARGHLDFSKAAYTENKNYSETWLNITQVLLVVVF